LDDCGTLACPSICVSVTRCVRNSLSAMLILSCYFWGRDANSYFVVGAVGTRANSWYSLTVNWPGRGGVCGDLVCGGLTGDLCAWRFPPPNICLPSGSWLAAWWVISPVVAHGGRRTALRLLHPHRTRLRFTHHPDCELTRGFFAALLVHTWRGLTPATFFSIPAWRKFRFPTIRCARSAPVFGRACTYWRLCRACGLIFALTFFPPAAWGRSCHYGYLRVPVYGDVMVSTT